MTPAEAVRAACAMLDARRSTKRLIVGIDGAGGAGKSTLANGLSDAFAGRVSVIRCDDFYRPLHAALNGAELSPAQACEAFFDWRRLREEVLRPVRSGKNARYQRYDWSIDGLAEWIQVDAREIVLVEGVFSTRPELRPLIDVAIFVNTPRDERVRRMLDRRQPSTSWIDPWVAAEDWYLAHLAPHLHADLVVEGF